MEGEDNYGKVPSTALDIEGIDLVPEDVDVGRLDGGVAATMEDEVLVRPAVAKTD